MTTHKSTDGDDTPIALGRRGATALRLIFLSLPWLILKKKPPAEW
jgi:hypothetical protein